MPANGNPIGNQRPNRRIVLRERATGLPEPGLFEAVEDDAPAPGDGEVLLRNVYVSADPGMKGWISVAKNYNSVELGATMQSFVVGEIVESRHPDFAEGTFLAARGGWAEYDAIDPTRPSCYRVNPDEAPLSTALGVLGVNGLTAYFGMLDIGDPQSGETVVVSTAAGAVGSAAGQIAKIKGARTVGIAGGPEKTALCRDAFGYDAAIDYKAVPDLGAALAEACPDGIDVYYDNVGGTTLDTVMNRLAVNARVIICGTAATESWTPPPSGPRIERNILITRARVQGVLLLDHFARFPAALTELRHWFKEGKLAYREEIAEGLDAAPAALAGLYEGRNMGRQLIRVRPDPTI